MSKTKLCKGSGVASGNGCGIDLPFSERNGLRTYKSKYGLGLDCGCYQKWLTTTEKGKEVIKRTTLKVKANREQLQKGLIRAMSERELPKKLSQLKVQVHKFVRERDKGKPCISCNRPWHPDFQAGHYFKAELYSWLKFDLRNIHGQCQYCNIQKEGNVLEYAKRLPERIGKEAFVSLVQDSAKKHGKRFKWNIQELKEISKKIRETRKQWLIVHKSKK